MQIHIGRGGQQLGTFNADEVREGLARGTFLPTDLAWREGMGEWQPLSSFADLQPQTSAGSPVMPPSQVPQNMAPAAAGTPQKSGLALGALICGIIAMPGMFCCGGMPLGIAAVICGHLALAEIKKKPHLQDSRGLAMAGLVMGYIAIAVSVLLIIFQVGMVGVSALSEGLKDAKTH